MKKQIKQRQSVDLGIPIGFDDMRGLTPSVKRAKKIIETCNKEYDCHIECDMLGIFALSEEIDKLIEKAIENSEECQCKHYSKEARKTGVYTYQLIGKELNLCKACERKLRNQIIEQKKIEDECCIIRKGMK